MQVITEKQSLKRLLKHIKTIGIAKKEYSTANFIGDNETNSIYVGSSMQAVEIIG